MPKTKIAIALHADVLARLDELLEKAGFRSRSQAVEAAIAEKLERLERTHLARECAKLDPDFERALAEAAMTEDLEEWAAY